jgi:tRNA(fMet)-specific endonuclease VapC
VEILVREVAVLPLGDEALRKFGQIKSGLRKQEQVVADFDLLIASTGIANGVTLVTNNLKHYSRIPDLKLDNWLFPSQ